MMLKIIMMMTTVRMKMDFDNDRFNWPEIN